MKLTPPTQAMWFIALILGIIGVLATLVTINGISSSVAFWLVAAGWLILVLATALKDL